jgi:hypothetical protein
MSYTTCFNLILQHYLRGERQRFMNNFSVFFHTVNGLPGSSVSCYVASANFIGGGGGLSYVRRNRSHEKRRQFIWNYFAELNVNKNF